MAATDSPVAVQVLARGIGPNPLVLPTKPGTDLSDAEAAATALGGGISVAGVTTQQTTSVPEPTTLLLFGGALAIVVRRMKR